MVIPRARRSGDHPLLHTAVRADGVVPADRLRSASARGGPRAPVRSRTTPWISSAHGRTPASTWMAHMHAGWAWARLRTASSGQAYSVPRASSSTCPTTRGQPTRRSTADGCRDASPARPTPPRGPRPPGLCPRPVRAARRLLLHLHAGLRRLRGRHIREHGRPVDRTLRHRHQPQRSGPLDTVGDTARLVRLRPARLVQSARPWPLGVRPTAATSVPLLDAYLWIKIPGESDGCAIAGTRRAHRIPYAESWTRRQVNGSPTWR